MQPGVVSLSSLAGPMYYYTNVWLLLDAGVPPASPPPPSRPKSADGGTVSWKGWQVAVVAIGCALGMGLIMSLLFVLYRRLCDPVHPPGCDGDASQVSSLPTKEAQTELSPCGSHPPSVRDGVATSHHSGVLCEAGVALHAGDNSSNTNSTGVPSVEIVVQQMRSGEGQDVAAAHTHHTRTPTHTQRAPPGGAPDCTGDSPSPSSPLSPPASAASQQQQQRDPLAEVRQLMTSMGSDQDKLVILHEIGRGGFGTVFKGRWRGLDVAVKTVLFQDRSLVDALAAEVAAYEGEEDEFEAGGGAEGDGGDAVGNWERARHQALREAAVCSSISHPCVVATYHVDITQVGGAHAHTHTQARTHTHMGRLHGPARTHTHGPPPHHHTHTHTDRLHGHACVWL